MTDETEPTDRPATGERIAKRIARAGVASRREAERLIDAGRVTVNGEVIRSPAFDVAATDEITIDGTPLPKPERTRLWRYYKPAGLLVSRTDPRGRRTIYMDLPPELGHAISVGRLDFNSEGLLLLTNDGELSRKLELPDSGLMRRYRARAFGHIDQKALDRLKNGITVEGVRYGPIQATLEEARGANAWIGLSLAEGKNREVRKVLAALGLKVNRLIRTHYGPFALGDMPPGAVAEIPAASLMRDLGVATERPKGWAKAKPKLKQRPGKKARLAARKAAGDRPQRERPMAERRDQRQEHRPGDRRPSGNLHRTRHAGAERQDDDRARPRKEADRPSGTRRDDRAARPDQDRRGPPRTATDRPGTERTSPARRDERRSERPNADRREPRPEHRPGDRRPSGNPHREATRAEAPRRDDKRPEHGRRDAERSFSGKRNPSVSDRPNADRRGADRPFAARRDDRPSGDRPHAAAREGQRGGPDRRDAERPRSDRPGPRGPHGGPHRGPRRGPNRGPNADRRR